jgi:hypothetical protein
MMADLYEVRPFHVYHGGRFPFDMYVEEICQEFRIPCELIGPVEREIRLSVDYGRDPDLAALATLVVAFPAEDAESTRTSKKYAPESADVDVMRGAAEHGIPVLAVYRNGDAVWIS